MSDKPLYYSKNFNKPIHPAKILPSLLEKQKKPETNKNKQHYEGIFIGRELPKQKKIKKEDNKKFYRTKMCPKGRDCKNRFTCSFAHTQQQLRKPFIKRKNPCLLYQRGLCSLGSACKDYHGNIDLQKNYNYKQKICENYINGSCLKGNFCIYIHQAPQSQQQKLKQEPGNEQIQNDIREGEKNHKQENNKQEQGDKKQLQMKEQNNQQDDAINIDDVVISFN